PEIDPLSQVVDFLNGQKSPTLLVLDNLEHLLAEERRKSEDGAVVVRALLEQVPSVHLLVTSRQLLALEGERELAVTPLPVPDSRPYSSAMGERMPYARETEPARPRISPRDAMEFAGVQLFVDRAQTVQPDFQMTSR